MSRLVILIVVVATYCNASPAGDKKENCVGCPQTADVNDPSIIKKVNAVMQQANTAEQLAKIMSVTTQVVSGIKYNVEIMTARGRRCHLSWVEQPWVSEQPQYLKFDCDPAA